jgi:hypothetical protein
MILIYLLKNNWLYFVLVILLVSGEIYTYIKNKQFKKIILCLSIYSVVYFNIFVPTYAAGRPNYYFYMYIIFIAISLLNDIIKKYDNIKKICYIILSITTISLLSYEIYIYKNIGNYYRERINQIETYKKENSNESLYLTEIPTKYNSYHMDINLPNRTWFTYESFINYYNLPKEIDIEYVKSNKK